MRSYFFTAIIFLSVACSSSKETYCKKYFKSCNKKAELPTCEQLVTVDSAKSQFVPPLNDLVATIEFSEVKKYVQETGDINSFSKNLKEDHTYWYYDNSGKIDGGMVVGTEGIVALKNCSVLSAYTIVTYN